MSELRVWLEKLGLEKYSETFADNGIDLRALPFLTEQDFIDLGVLLGHRRILLSAVESLPQLQPGPADKPGEHRPSTADAAEYRQVTILFADLVGFTKMSSELDAEEIHTILGHFLDAADSIIIKHGGTVDKHIGDCAMAIFGAPVAHSNDPLRAVRAALEIQQAMPAVSELSGREINTHIGIANGQVIASGVGNDAHYTVTGDSVNMASRLTDAANKGETMLSQGVQLAVSEDCELEDRGEIHVKGISDPVRAYSLRGLASAVSGSGDHSFVGRQAELQQFTGILNASMETGSGQAVLLRGEAGIGKTRLSVRFENIARDLGYDCHRVLVLDFGVSKEQNVLSTLVRSLLSISSDSENAVREAAANRSCARGVLESGQRVYLNELLDIPQSIELRSLYDALDSDAREQGRVKTVTTLIGHLSRENPVLITVEDIHWADESELIYLGQITKLLVDHPCILVMTSRIEGDPLDQCWKLQAAETPLATIDLRPLRQDDAMELAADYLDSSSQFAQTCVERAGGNPFFLEQLLRSAEESGECQIPGSVHSIVQARLDSLEAVDKQAVQAASVLGQRFKLEDLRHMIDEAGYDCAGLIERNLVRKEGEAYLFAHALVQEAVYQSLVKSRQAKLHRQAAQWYQQREPELCAVHLDRAGDPAAAQAYYVAAKVQLDDLQFKSSLELAERGLELVETTETRCDLMLVQAEAFRNQGKIEESIAACKSALNIANNGQQACRAQLELAEGLRIIEQQEPALDALDKAESIAVEHNLTQALTRIKYLRGNLYFMLGNIDGCLAEHEKSLHLAEETESAEGRALALGGLGDAYYLKGAMQSARDQYQACIDLCREHGFGRIEVANRNMVGWSRMYLMEFPQSIEDAVASIELAAKVSHHRAEMLSLELAGTVEVERGRMAEARTYLERCLEISTRMDAGNFIAQTYLLLARQTAAIGQVSEAQSFIGKAVSKVREVGMVFIGPAILSVHAELTDDPAQRLSSLQEAEALLDKGCVSHNYFTFCRVAIEISLKEEAWDEVERHALRLEAYTAGQPLAWSDFIIARGRALAAWRKGDRSDDLKRKIEALYDQAVQAEWKRVLPGLEEVVSE